MIYSFTPMLLLLLKVILSVFLKFCYDFSISVKNAFRLLLAMTDYADYFDINISATLIFLTLEHGIAIYFYLL